MDGIEAMVKGMGGRVVVCVAGDVGLPRGWLFVDRDGDYVAVEMRGGGEMLLRQGNLDDVEPVEPVEPEPEPGPNLIVNGDFGEGTAGWVFHAGGGGSFGVVDADTPGTWPAARLVVDRADGNVQLYQSGIGLRPGVGYVLSFAARSSGGEWMGVFVHDHESPYGSYGLAGVAELSGVMGEYSFEFVTPDAVGDNARLRFWLAPYAGAGSEYFIGRVELREKGGGGKRSGGEEETGRLGDWEIGEG